MKPIALFAALILASTVKSAFASEDAYAAFVSEKATVWLADPIVQSAIAASNTTHATLVASDISNMDEVWQAELDGDASPLITQILSAPASDYLREIVDSSQGIIAEIILMDNRGLNAAMSGVTSDFWQGDEDKFQQTFGKAGGVMHVGAVELDDSSGTYVVQVSVPVVDAAGSPIGAATFSLDAERL